MSTTDQHYTAWLTTDATMVTNDTMDVVVLADEEQESGRYDDAGEPILDWFSTGDPLFHADTSTNVRDGDHEDGQRDAVQLLEDAGWVVRGDWKPVASGYVATVERTA